MAAEPPAPPDPSRPLWQAAIGPMTESEWKLTRPRRMPVVCWAYALAAVLCLYLSTSAFDFSEIALFGASVPRAVLFLPLHAVLFSTSLAVFLRRISTALWRERGAWENYRLLEAPGRLVTVYCDRITAQGETDVVTVPLAGAELHEYPTLLTVSNGGKTVTVRGENISSAQAAALSALLTPAAAKRYGKTAMMGRVYPAPWSAPTLRAPTLMFSAPFTLTRAAAFSARLRDFFRRQWIIWAPLMCLCALMLTDCLPENQYFWLYYGTIVLSVLLISALIPTLALLWDAGTDRRLPKSGRWLFFPDRLSVVTEEGKTEYARRVMTVAQDKRSVRLCMTGCEEQLPRCAFADPAAMEAFVTRGITQSPADGTSAGQ